jgi:hypothetical protein
MARSRAPYQVEGESCCSRDRVRTKCGWSFVADADKVTTLELQSQPRLEASEVLVPLTLVVFDETVSSPLQSVLQFSTVEITPGFCSFNRKLTNALALIDKT